jgi:molybdopterin-biosynthesis enzyme MoeA-like protein
MHVRSEALKRERTRDVALENGQPYEPDRPDNIHRLNMGRFPAGASIIPNPYNKIAGFSCEGRAGGAVHFVPGFPVMAWPMIAGLLDGRYAPLHGRQRQAERSVIVYGAAEAALTPLMEALEAAHPGAKVFSLPSVDHPEHGRHIELQGADQGIEHRGVRVIAQAPGHRLAHVAVVVSGQQGQQGFHRQRVGVAPQGIDGAHPQDWAAGRQQRQQQGHGPGIPVFAEDAQSLHALLLGAAQPGDAGIAFGGHIQGRRLGGVDLIERITEQLPVDSPGVRVSAVQPNGWAALAGIGPGDIIVSIDGQVVKTVADAEKLLKACREAKPGQVVFFVRRGVNTMFAEVEPRW